MKLFWKIFFWINLLVVGLFWFQTSGSLLSGDVYSVAIALGRLTGLVGMFLIFTQFVLMSRVPLLERFFGHDHLTKQHQTQGKIAWIVLLFHPVLLIIGYGAINDLGFGAQYWQFVADYPYVVWASAGFLLLTAVVATSLAIIRLRLRYETWYFAHLLVYLAVLGAVWHQFAVGTDLLARTTFYGYWLALYIIVFGMFVISRFLTPLWKFAKHRFAVDRVVRETPLAVSVYIRGTAMDQFRFEAGQFLIVRFLTRGMWWQAHPFSFSKAYDGKELRVTIKASGDFSKNVADLQAGVAAIIEGPYGVFTERFVTKDKALLIAGGIGITPIRSLVESMAKTGKESVLLYGCRDETDMALSEELSGIVGGNEKIKMIPVMSNQDEYEGEKGRIDGERLKRLVPDFKDRDIYLCGPGPMMEALVQFFKAERVPAAQLHYEVFSFTK